MHTVRSAFKIHHHWCLQNKSVLRCDIVNSWLVFRRAFRPSLVSSAENEDTKKRTTLYDALELDPNATSSEIKETYLQLSKKYHPDRNPNDEAAAQRFHEVSQAYTTLGNAKLRRLYDKGQLGRAISVADREQISHTFEGAAFVQNRQDFKEKFGNSDRDMWKNSKDHTEDYIRKTSSWNFHQRQSWKKGENTINVAPPGSGARRSVADNRRRFDTHDSSSGGPGFFFFFCVFGLIFVAVKVLL